MAKVFTGRVVVPGDRIKEYFDALQKAETARVPFRQSLEQLNQEFADFLAAKYVPKTVRKRTGIVDLFIHFICGYTDVEKKGNPTMDNLTRILNVLRQALKLEIKVNSNFLSPFSIDPPIGSCDR